MKEPDTLLLPFLGATDETQAQQCLERLLKEHAEPVIRAIVGRMWPGRRKGEAADPAGVDAEDLRGEAVGHLLTRLRDCKRNPDSEAISDFRAYVAVTTYRVCDQQKRRTNPGRQRIKNQLRYLLTHQSGFALWQVGGESLCGYAAWRAGEQQPAGRSLCEDLLRSPESLARAAPDAVESPDLAVLVAAIFDWAGGPVELDDLAGAITALKESRGPALPSACGGGDAAAALAGIADPALSPEERLAWRENLRWLWDAVCQLPLEQRRAFLLNLEILDEFWLEDVAALPEIAGQLEVPASELAEWWARLPLDDGEIGQRFGASRGTTAKRRFDARERLREAWRQRG